MNGPRRTACFTKGVHNCTFSLSTVHISHFLHARHWCMPMRHFWDCRKVRTADNPVSRSCQTRHGRTNERTDESLRNNDKCRKDLFFATHNSFSMTELCLNNSDPPLWSLGIPFSRRFINKTRYLLSVSLKAALFCFDSTQISLVSKGNNRFALILHTLTPKHSLSEITAHSSGYLHLN